MGRQTISRNKLRSCWKRYKEEYNTSDWETITDMQTKTILINELRYFINNGYVYLVEVYYNSISNRYYRWKLADLLEGMSV